MSLAVAVLVASGWVLTRPGADAGNAHQVDRGGGVTKAASPSEVTPGTLEVQEESSGQASSVAEGAYRLSLIDDLRADGRPAASVFNALWKAATEGNDPVASYLVFDLFRRCNGVPRDQAALDSAVVAIEQRSLAPARKDQAMNELARHFSLCEGMPPGKLRDEYAAEFVTDAARAGIVDAKREFLPQNLIPFNDPIHAVNNVEQFNQLLDEGLRHLHDAMLAGDEASVLRLADVYSSNIEVVSDSARAAALYELMAEGSSSAAARTIADEARLPLTPDQLERMRYWLDWYRDRFPGG